MFDRVKIDLNLVAFTSLSILVNWLIKHWYWVISLSSLFSLFSSLCLEPRLIWLDIHDECCAFDNSPRSLAKLCLRAWRRSSRPKATGTSATCSSLSAAACLHCCAYFTLNRMRSAKTRSTMQRRLLCSALALQRQRWNCAIVPSLVIRERERERNVIKFNVSFFLSVSFFFSFCLFASGLDLMYLIFIIRRSFNWNSSTAWRQESQSVVWHARGCAELAVMCRRSTTCCNFHWIDYFFLLFCFV